MSEYVFPDNTVLCNFAAVDRVNLLRAVLKGEGRWVEAVHGEAEKSAKHLPKLAAVLADGWLGKPIKLDSKKARSRIEDIRLDVFGGFEDEPTKHLGEAQTCYLIAESGRFNGSSWISDDRESVQYAKGRGIATGETIDLMAAAVGAGLISDQMAFDEMRLMKALGRHPRQPRNLAELRR
ncbi:hypothetical protein [Nocardia lasii]|uniref:Nucleic acid-binding protein n=1 Tax=Nocardia lasii TaxID=1616107 RepID=A0ABW1JN71_9NOCA